MRSQVDEGESFKDVCAQGMPKKNAVFNVESPRAKTTNCYYQVGIQIVKPKRISLRTTIDFAKNLKLDLSCDSVYTRKKVVKIKST